MRIVSSAMLAGVAALSLVLSARAEISGDGHLSTSISNSYWCTWAYVNPVPNAAPSQSVDVMLSGCTTSSADLDDAVLRGSTWSWSSVLHRFSSLPASWMILYLR